MPLLTSFGSARSFGFGASIGGGAGQELLGTLDIPTTTGTTTYDFTFNGADYKSLIISGEIKRNGSGSWMPIYLLTSFGTISGNGMRIGRQSSYHNLYEYETTSLVQSVGTTPSESTSFTFHIGSIDQSQKPKPIWGPMRTFYDSARDDHAEVTGHYNFNNGAVTGIRFYSSPGFGPSYVNIYGVKSA